MKGGTRRLEKIESSLTPKQAVIRWINEAHQYPGMLEYIESLSDAPESAFPMYLLPNQVEKAVRERMTRRPRDEIWQEVRQAVRDAVFLFHLHQHVNSAFQSEHNENVFCAHWLKSELQWLLHKVTEQQLQRVSTKRRKRNAERGMGKVAWKTSMDTYLSGLYVHREVAAAISHRYFDGNSALYPEVAEGHSRVLEAAEHLAGVFNDSVIIGETTSGRKRLPKGIVDLDELEARAKRLAESRVGYLVDMAKAEALDFMGDNRTAVSLVERHVWPE